MDCSRIHPNTVNGAIKACLAHPMMAVPVPSAGFKQLHGLTGRNWWSVCDVVGSSPVRPGWTRRKTVDKNNLNKQNKTAISVEHRAFLGG